MTLTRNSASCAVYAVRRALCGRAMWVIALAISLSAVIVFLSREIRVVTIRDDGMTTQHYTTSKSAEQILAQNVGAGNLPRAKRSMFTGIGVGLVFGCAMFALVMLRGDMLSGIFTTDAEVVEKGFEYLRGFAPETIATAILFSMVGYFNGCNRTLWVMVQGLVQTLLVRLPLAYFMSIQPNASLTKIGLAAPISTAVGVVLNICFYRYLAGRERKS